jgi:tRNA (cmo5U34)-methyltransferase
MPATQAENMLTLKERLPVLTPQQDAELLDEAGFRDIDLFYCAFTFKGWVAYKT